MRLESLTLTNFRQFHGEETIVFGQDETKNVTVVHGENGAGKTALLNAFKWVFYGETDFDSGTERLACQRAIAEASGDDRIPVKVEVKFLHNGLHHTAVRQFVCRPTSDMTDNVIGDVEFSVSWTDADGSHKSSDSPGTYINQIIPKSLHPFFFFNGERIERLARMDASAEIQSAIKSMMGLTIVERAHKHVRGPVLTSLRATLKKASKGHDSLKRVVEEEEMYSDQLQAAEDKIEELQQNSTEVGKELRIVQGRQRAIREIEALEQEREQLNARIERNLTRLSELRETRRTRLSKEGFLVFVDSLVSQTQQLLEEKRKRGELPALVRSQFIDDLLERSLCICQRELEEGSDARSAVKKYRASSTSSDVEEAFLTTSSAVSNIPSDRERLLADLKGLRQQRRELMEQDRVDKARVVEISNQVTATGHEDATKLEERRRQLESRRDQLNQDLGLQIGERDRCMKQLAEARKRREGISQLGEEVELERRRVDAADEISRVLEELLDSLSTRVREELSGKVDKTFRGIIKKSYWAEIDDNYLLQIYKMIGDEKHPVHDKSTGESQVASLAFIGSIVALAKKRHAEPASYYKGGLYPIVMDSPYGQLDPEYRLRVAEAIPRLAEQVILFATDSQWRGEVESQIGDKVAKHYTLIYHTPKPKAESHLVRRSEKYEHTSIEENYRGR